MNLPSTGAAGTTAPTHPGRQVIDCPCSRGPGRAAPRRDVTCPPGSGATEYAMIGPAGGTLAMVTGKNGQTLTLDVPAGALPKPTLLSVTELAASTPAGYTDFTPIYAFGPLGLRFRVPAMIRVPWKLEIGPGVTFFSMAALALYGAGTVNGPWAPLPGSYHNAGYMQASVDSLGHVFAGYPASLDPPSCTLP